MESMVIKGLDQDTNYQFSVRAINSYGSSSRSLPSDLARTFGEYWGPSEVLALLGLRTYWNRVSWCLERV